MRSNRDLRALLKLRSLIAAGRYDVVHAHLFRSQVYARPAARLARTPVVVTTEHSIGETHIERRKMTAGVRGLYLASELFSDATIAVSDVVRDRLIRWGVPARKITVIPNGLDTAALAFDPAARRAGPGTVRHRAGDVRDRDAWPPRPEQADRHGHRGGGAAARRAVRAPHRRPRRGRWTRLKAAADKAGVADRVIFAGFQADTVAMLSAFDLYVMASVQETFGLAALEAMANGLPVLYTACPALDGIPTSAGTPGRRDPSALRAAFSDAVDGRPAAARSQTTRSSSSTASRPSPGRSTTSTSASGRAERNDMART